MTNHDDGWRFPLDGPQMDIVPGASLRASLPRDAWPVVRQGLVWLVDYQDTAYAELYSVRLRTLAAVAPDGALITQTARHLAAWMAYEDPISTARNLLYRWDRQPIGTSAGDATRTFADRLTLDSVELCRLLPPRLGRRLERYIEAKDRKDRIRASLPVRRGMYADFARLRLLAGLRRWRPACYGFHEEQRLIGAWLLRIEFAARKDIGFATEIAHCAEVVRGSGQDRRRRHGILQRICDSVIDPILDGRIGASANDAARLRCARIASMITDTLGKRNEDPTGVGSAASR